MRQRFALAAAAAVAAVAAFAAPAAFAHSVVGIENGQLRYDSVDGTSKNELSISESGSNYRVYDPTADGGLDPGGSGCTPGAINSSGQPIELFCPKSGITSLFVDLGPLDDKSVLTVPLDSTTLGGDGNDVIGGTGHNDRVNGEAGNDTIDAGAGDDTVTGDVGDDKLTAGDGNDIVHGGPGNDTFSGGAGDDELRSRDGGADTVSCGAGTDKVVGDDADSLPADAACESVERSPTESPGGGTPGGGSGDVPPELVVKADRIAPRLKLGGPSRQRGKAARVLVFAVADEAGTLTASCTVRVDGKRFALKKLVQKLQYDGQGTQLAFVLPAQVAKAIRAALARRSTRVSARFTVTAADDQGNKSVPTTRSVRLFR
jgi:hypothetical protein